jgi:hypothetical protein
MKRRSDFLNYHSDAMKGVRLVESLNTRGIFRKEDVIAEIEKAGFVFGSAEANYNRIKEFLGDIKHV